MGTRDRDEPAAVYTNIGVHADVEIMLTTYRNDGESATIRFGKTSRFGNTVPDVTIDFCDVDSLQRLADIAAAGARQLRERLDADSQTRSQTNQPRRRCHGKPPPHRHGQVAHGALIRAGTCRTARIKPWVVMRLKLR